MKNKITQIVFLISLTFGLTAFAQAQTASQYRVNIPFDFTVRGKTFQAGEYSINYGGLSGSRNKLLIRSKNRKNAALVIVMPEQTNRESVDPSVVFVYDENEYVLSELKTYGTNVKIGRPKSRPMLAKNFRAVELALNR